MKYKNIKIKSEGLNNTKHKVEKLRQNKQIQAKKRTLYDFIFDSDSNQAPLVIKHRELKKSASKCDYFEITAGKQVYTHIQ